MKSASLTANLLASKGAAKPSLPREILDPDNYADQVPMAFPIPKETKTKFLNGQQPSSTINNQVENNQAKDDQARISTTVRLPSDIHKRLRLLAARDRINLQALLERATANLLAQELGDEDCICSGDIKN